LNLLLKTHVEQIKVSAEPERIEHFIATFYPDIIILDMNFNHDAVGGHEGFYWLEKIKKNDPDIVVIFITAYADMDKAIQAIKAGAMDFIPKPWEKEKLLATVFSALELRYSKIEIKHLKQQISALTAPSGTGKHEIIGESSAMTYVFDTIEKLRNTDANILILGENGTGKDLIAHEIHRKSFQSPNRFSKANCSDIRKELSQMRIAISRDDWRLPPAARCFWTKSETSRFPCK
jgi:DNA-binding NtrC family response regulator